MSFNYVLAQRTTDRRLSTFQGFDTDWLSATPLIEAVLLHPAHIMELRSDLADRVKHRCRGYGRYNVFILSDGVSVEPIPFMVLLTSPQVDDEGRAYIARHQDEPILHLPSIPRAGETGLRANSLDAFEKWLQKLTDYAAREKPEYVQDFRRLQALPRRSPTTGAVRSDGTYLTYPNDYTLVSVGAHDHPALLASGPASVGAASESSFSAIQRVRETFVSAIDYPPGPTAAIICTASVARYLPAVLPRDDRVRLGEAASGVYRDIRRQAAMLEPEAIGTQHPDPNARSLAKERKAEIDTQIVLATLEACCQFTPTIMVPNGFRLAESAIKAVHQELTRADPSHTRICSLARTAGEAMRDCLPAFARDTLSSLKGAIKAFSDDPIEWLDCDGKPLIVTKPVVRVPVTPGFVMANSVASCDAIFLHPRDFTDVIVLRGTLRDDRVHAILEDFCRSFEARAPGLRVRVVDVASVDDVREALSTFTGAVAIVDAHGFHEERGAGLVELGGRRQPLSEPSLTFPPIVLLAVCDSHPIGRSQDTIATSLIASGARAVVGTLSKVDAVQSGAFFASLLARIEGILPALPGPIRWSDFFARHLWASHVYEAASGMTLMAKPLLSNDDVAEIHWMVEHDLMRFKEDWMTAVIQEIAKRSGQAPESIELAWRENAYLTQSCLYCQIGQADSLIMAPSDSWGSGTRSAIGA